MNAIILSLNRSFSSNNNSNISLFKINNLFNIERTILMLNDVGILDITIIVEKFIFEYNYLKDKYNCKIISITNSSISLSCILYKLKNKIKDTFIIDGNIVLAQNIFQYKPFSYCYVSNDFYYRHFCFTPIIAKDKHIIGYKRRKKYMPYFLGIIFLSKKDFNNCQFFLNSVHTDLKFNRKKAFLTLVHSIDIYVKRVPYNTATKINNKYDYIHCIKMCKQYYLKPNKYFLNLYDYKNHFLFLQNKQMAMMYTRRLWMDYNNKHPQNPQNLNEPINFLPNEFPFIIFIDGIDIGFIDLIYEFNHIRLKRMYINKKHRNLGIGTQIIKKINTFCLLSGNELQVNVYDEAATRFYVRLGFKNNFTNYLLKGILS